MRVFLYLILVCLLTSVVYASDKRPVHPRGRDICRIPTRSTVVSCGLTAPEVTPLKAQRDYVKRDVEVQTGEANLIVPSELLAQFIGVLVQEPNDKRDQDFLESIRMHRLQPCGSALTDREQVETEAAGPLMHHVSSVQEDLDVLEMQGQLHKDIVGMVVAEDEGCELRKPTFLRVVDSDGDSLEGFDKNSLEVSYNPGPARQLTRELRVCAEDAVYCEGERHFRALCTTITLFIQKHRDILQERGSILADGEKLPGYIHVNNVLATFVSIAQEAGYDQSLIPQPVQPEVTSAAVGL